MQQKYVEYYTATLFHKWFGHIFKHVGDTPFRAAIQNFLYVQDPNNPDKVRIQSFINGLLEFVEKLKALPDPDPEPILPDISMNSEILEKYIKAAAKPVSVLSPNFKMPEDITIPPFPETATPAVWIGQEQNT